MSQPYTYLVVHKKTGDWYYGVRYANGCKPEDLWVSYFTSSDRIASIIALEGEDSFEVSVRKVFSDSKSAINWEFRVLKKLFRHPKCLNGSCFPAVDDIALANSHKTKSTIGSDGLTGYQRAGLKLRDTLAKVDPSTGLTLAQSRARKADYTNSSKVARERALKDNPVNREGVRSKISDSVKRAHAEGRLNTNKGMKMPIISERLMGNDYATGAAWYNNGRINFRAKPGQTIPDGFIPGRLPFKVKEYPVLTCPNCGLQGKGGNMKKYHFDNCKQPLIIP